MMFGPEYGRAVMGALALAGILIFIAGAAAAALLIWLVVL